MWITQGGHTLGDDGEGHGEMKRSRRVALVSRPRHAPEDCPSDGHWNPRTCCATPTTISLTQASCRRQRLRHGADVTTPPNKAKRK